MINRKWHNLFHRPLKIGSFDEIFQEEHKVIYTSLKGTPPRFDVRDAFKEEILEYSTGQFAYVGSAAKYLRGLYELVLEEVVRPLGFEDILLPRLHPVETAELFGLVEAWPFYLLEARGFDISRGKQTIGNQPRKYVMDPVQCMGFYILLKKYKHLRERANARYVEFLGGWTFRNEDRDKLNYIYKTLEFNRIEMVYYGEKEFILESRKEVLAKFFDLFDAIGLQWRLEIGQGCYERPSAEELAQYINTTKVLDAPVLDIALHTMDSTGPAWMETVGADNAMKNKVKRFKIQTPYFSGCTGIGLNRLLAAVFCVYDPANPQSWPEKLRKYLV